MSPEQVIYDYVYTVCEGLGYKTYDHLPMGNENAPYPFVLVGEINSNDNSWKTVVGSLITLTVHVWGDEEQRFVVSDMADSIVNGLRKCHNSEGYSFINRINQTQKQFIQDTSVSNTVLNHGVLTLVFSLL